MEFPYLRYTKPNTSTHAPHNLYAYSIRNIDDDDENNQPWMDNETKLLTYYEIISVQTIQWPFITWIMYWWCIGIGRTCPLLVTIYIYTYINDDWFDADTYHNHDIQVNKFLNCNLHLKWRSGFFSNTHRIRICACTHTITITTWRQSTC